MSSTKKKSSRRSKAASGGESAEAQVAAFLRARGGAASTMQLQTEFEALVDAAEARGDDFMDAVRAVASKDGREWRLKADEGGAKESDAKPKSKTKASSSGASSASSTPSKKKKKKSARSSGGGGEKAAAAAAADATTFTVAVRVHVAAIGAPPLGANAPLVVRAGKSRTARRAYAQSAAVLRKRVGATDRELRFATHVERRADGAFARKPCHLLLCEAVGADAVRLARTELDLGAYAARSEAERETLELELCRGVKGAADGQRPTLTVRVELTPLKANKRRLTLVDDSNEAAAAHGDTVEFGANDYLLDEDESESAEESEAPSADDDADDDPAALRHARGGGGDDDDDEEEEGELRAAPEASTAAAGAAATSDALRELEAKLASRSKAASDAEARAAAAEEARDATATELANLKAAHDALTAAADGVDAKLSEVEGERDEAIAKRDQLAAANESLEAQLARDASAREALQAELDKARAGDADAEALASERDRLASEKSDLEQQLSDAAAQHDATLDALKTELAEQHDAALDKLRNELDEKMRAEVASLEEQCTKLKSDLDERDSALDAERQRVADASAASAELEALCEDLKSKLESAEQAQTNSTKLSESNNDELRAENERLKAQVQELEKAAASAADEIDGQRLHNSFVCVCVCVCCCRLSFECILFFAVIGITPTHFKSKNSSFANNVFFFHWNFCFVHNDQ